MIPRGGRCGIPVPGIEAPSIQSLRDLRNAPAFPGLRLLGEQLSRVEEAVGVGGAQRRANQG